MVRSSVVVITASLGVVLTSCSDAEELGAPGLESLTAQHQSDVQDAGFEVSLAASGLSGTGSIEFEFGEDYRRDWLTLLVSCAAEEGEAIITVVSRDTSAITANCDPSGTLQEISAPLWPYGEGLEVRTDDVPDDAAWVLSFAHTSESD